MLVVAVSLKKILLNRKNVIVILMSIELMLLAVNINLVAFSWALYFFFQAEDGIRDGTVTGVQTCALPIYLDSLQELAELEIRAENMQTQFDDLGAARSEERRVGKECRCWWSRYH